MAGSVAIQALNATLNWGLNRSAAIFTAGWLSATYALNQALKVDASKFRWSRASRSARLDLVRAAEARASVSDDSVPHFDDAKPDQAARTATTASRIASDDRDDAIMPVASPWSPLWPLLACLPISFPTSVADSPSATRRSFSSLSV